MESLLSRLYYSLDKPYGYSSKRKLYQAAKQENSKITLDIVERWLQSQTVPGKFFKGKKIYPRALFISRKPGHTFLAFFYIWKF